MCIRDRPRGARRAHLLHPRMTDRITLSVILATIEPWPDLANCLEVLEQQVAAVGGEIIVGDGHGEALDAAKAASSERLSWVRMPGASVFELRARHSHPRQALR